MFSFATLVFSLLQNMSQISGAIYVLTVVTVVTVWDYLSTLQVQTAVVLCKQLHSNVVVLVSICSSVIIFMTALYLMMSKIKNIYLVDFACYKPHASLMMTKEEGYSRISHFFGEEAGSFHKRIMERSGVGNGAYFPDSCKVLPPKFRFNESRKEVEMVVFGAVDELLAKTCVRARDIGILIVNSSTFNPTPSISAAIVNRFKFEEDVLTYNLGGMGCSAGLISIDLANRLLQEQPNSYALVVSTESITQNCYSGKVKSMMLTNCLFRIGGSAVLLSNRPSDGWRSKYQLNYLVRTHKGSDNSAYKCVYQEQDEDENIGIALSRDLTNIAGQALRSNMMRLGPLVLPMSEKILYLANFVGKRVIKMKIKSYVPDFKGVFDHFCIHAGGRAVIDGLEKSLRLTEYDTEPSRMTLYRFANTSSSSIWYELAYCEAKGRIKKKDRIWQIAFGSGFKCNSAVWSALRTITPIMGQNPWMDEIDNFPVNVSTCMPIVSDGLKG